MNEVAQMGKSEIESLLKKADEGGNLIAAGIQSRLVVLLRGEREHGDIFSSKKPEDKKLAERISELENLFAGRDQYERAEVVKRISTLLNPESKGLPHTEE